jgi:hypothetical protein
MVRCDFEISMPMAQASPKSVRRKIIGKKQDWLDRAIVYAICLYLWTIFPCTIYPVPKGTELILGISSTNFKSLKGQSIEVDYYLNIYLLKRPAS